jgi:hypothetical protein
METLMRYNFFQKDGENFIVIFISRKKENKGRPSFLNKNRAKNHVETLMRYNCSPRSSLPTKAELRFQFRLFHLLWWLG